jgi:hypothetical protein
VGRRARTDDDLPIHQHDPPDISAGDARAAQVENGGCAGGTGTAEGEPAARRKRHAIAIRQQLPRHRGIVHGHRLGRVQHIILIRPRDDRHGRGGVGQQRQIALFASADRADADAIVPDHAKRPDAIHLENEL